MMTTRKIVERRRYSRFPARYGSVAILRRHWPNSTEVCQIIDISMGGLALDRVPDEQESHGSFELELLLGDDSSRLRKIPFETIWDFKIDSGTDDNPLTKRCGIQFGKLTDNHELGLRTFIQNYTSADPES